MATENMIVSEDGNMEAIWWKCQHFNVAVIKAVNSITEFILLQWDKLQIWSNKQIEINSFRNEHLWSKIYSLDEYLEKTQETQDRFLGTGKCSSMVKNMRDQAMKVLSSITNK